MQEVNRQIARRSGAEVAGRGHIFIYNYLLANWNENDNRINSTGQTFI